MQFNISVNHWNFAIFIQMKNENEWWRKMWELLILVVDKIVFGVLSGSRLAVKDKWTLIKATQSVAKVGQTDFAVLSKNTANQRNVH